MGGERSNYVTVSLPIGIAKAIDSLIEELGYWPSRGSFAREACLEKIREERRRLRELREATEAAQSIARNRSEPRGENGPKEGKI